MKKVKMFYSKNTLFSNNHLDQRIYKNLVDIGIMLIYENDPKANDRLVSEPFTNTLANIMRGIKI